MLSTLLTNFLNAQHSVVHLRQHVTLYKIIVEKEPHLQTVLQAKDFLSDPALAMLLAVLHRL